MFAFNHIPTTTHNSVTLNTTASLFFRRNHPILRCSFATSFLSSDIVMNTMRIARSARKRTTQIHNLATHCAELGTFTFHHKTLPEPHAHSVSPRAARRARRQRLAVRLSLLHHRTSAHRRRVFRQPPISTHTPTIFAECLTQTGSPTSASSRLCHQT